jgi:arylsulfatase A-like enzyme
LASSSAVAPPKGKPNVLLVTLDTTRADRIGVYGNPEVATPVMDELANTGVRFVNASAVAAVTGPSHSSMLSGLAPWRSGVLLNGVALPSDQTMLAERLAEFGYSTAAFVSAYVLDGNLGFSRGFSVYDDEFSWLRGGGLLRPARAFAMFARRADPNAVLERRGGETVDLALSWLAEQGDKPWFLWVHLFDPHGPYAPPPPFDTRYYSGDENDPGHTSMQQVTGVAPYLERSLRGVTDLDFVLAQYAGEISYADSQIGRLVAEVSRSQTVIAVIGDHGESLGEHGVWFNHGDDVYESSVHVPFILNWAGTLPPSVLTSPVEGTDLATTLLARLGLPALGDGVDAVAATRVEAGSMCFDRATNLAERAAGRIEQPTFRIASVRGENARFIHREFDSRLEYFDLAAEPAGLLNSEPGFRQTEAGTALLPILQSHTAAMLAGDTSRSSAEVSDEERLKLEALGYLDQ